MPLPTARERAASPELRVVAKAIVSSLAATAADGVVYQLLLFVLSPRYALVAAFGAVAGAIVNFLINRHYTFQQSSERALPQAVRYAVVSFATYVALALLLRGMIEGLGWSERVAWLPAKLLAFAAVSYPAQRLWVFAKRVPA